MDSLRILGLTSEQYDQIYLEGCNLKFDTKTRSATRYYIYGEYPESGGFCKILLDENYENECYSGWTTATYGVMEKELVTTVPKLSHVPLVETFLEINFDLEEFECDLFNYSHSGGDHFYPSGYVKVNLDKFREVTDFSVKSARNI